MNISMIGVGKMGLPMARHLLASGYQVKAFDASPSARQGALDAGIQLHESLESAISAEAIIISSLPDDAAFLTVGQAVASQAQLGTIFLDTSTISLEASAKVAALCAERQIQYLRATVSGNNKMAEAAQLTVMASGPQATYERVKPILAAWGPVQFYLGDAEQARLMKLVINLMIAATANMLSEALVLGQKGGLDWKQMWDVICSSAVASPIIKAKAVQLREHDYAPTFTVAQMQKDVGIILAAGAQLHVPLAMTAGAAQQLQATAAQGDIGLDYAAVIRTVARAAGVDVK